MNGGPMQQIASTGNGNVEMIANTMQINDAVSTVSAGAGQVTMRQNTNSRTIDLGGADSGTQLGLTDAELDIVTAGILQIGNANTGAVNVSGAITQDQTTNIFANPGVTVLSNATLAIFGTVNSPLTVNGISNLIPGGSPGVINSGSVTFAVSSNFHVEIGGPTPGNGAGFHDQLNVTGTVSLGDTGLNI